MLITATLQSWVVDSLMCHMSHKKVLCVSLPSFAVMWLRNSDQTSPCNVNKHKHCVQAGPIAALLLVDLAPLTQSTTPYLVHHPPHHHYSCPTTAPRTIAPPHPPQVQSNALAALEAIDPAVADAVLREGCITGDRINGLCDGETGDW